MWNSGKPRDAIAREHGLQTRGSCGYNILQRTCATYVVLVYKLSGIIGVHGRVATVGNFFGKLLTRTVVKIGYFLVISHNIARKSK